MIDGNPDFTSLTLGWQGYRFGLLRGNFRTTSSDTKYKNRQDFSWGR
jgi:hypothetical protein